MTNKDKIKSIAPLHYQYSRVRSDSVPAEYKLFSIEHRCDETNEYEVVFYHRLMIKNYGPPEIEYDEDSIVNLPDGTVSAIGREWYYFIKTTSGNIIRAGTEDVHTRLKIDFVCSQTASVPIGKQEQDGIKFVDALLREAKRLKGQIFNIRKEFEAGGNTKLSLLSNVYLSNYRSGELMLNYSDANEQHIRDEVLKYDARNSLTDEQKDHIDRFRPGLGMYYAASISYFFMALEGFINILYYAFLKDEIRSEFYDRQKLNERLDISTKILLMPSTCKGFKTDQKASFFADLTRLKNSRNFLFHAKIADSLTSVTFVESGFLYTCDLDKNRKGVLPSQKTNLVMTDVLEVKATIDSIIRDIIDMLNDDLKPLVKRFVLHSLEIPFWYDKSGAIYFGSRNKKEEV